MPGEWDFDAITRYWYGPHVWGGTTSGAPYSTLAASALSDWTARDGNGAIQVPLVSAGADGRPRVETVTPWVPDPWFYEYYYEYVTPEELASHLGDAIDFVKAHPGSCESGAILVYSWNENDEGGWLTPTLDENGQIDDSRLKAIKELVAPLDTGGAAIKDASLKALIVDGDSVDGFNPTNFYYTIDLPYGSSNIPGITAISNVRYATVLITPPPSAEGMASIRVTSEDGTVDQTYFLFFKVSMVPPDSFGWEFNHAGDTEGWTTVWPGHATILVEDSVMVVNVTHNYPELVSSGNLGINAATYDKVTIRVKNKTNSSEWYFAFYDSDDQRTFHLITPVSTMDSTFKEYTMDLGGLSAWHGLIDRIELLPARKVGQGTVDVDYIRLEIIDGALSDDAKLASILVNGSPLAGFAQDSQFYTVVLPAGTMNLPYVEAVAEHPGSNISISQTQELSGSASVLVTSQSGLFQKTFHVGFEVEGYGETNDYFDFEDGVLPAGWPGTVSGYSVTVENGALVIRVSKTDMDDHYPLNEINFRTFDLYPWLCFSYQSDSAVIMPVSIIGENGKVSPAEEFMLPAASSWTDFIFNLAALATTEWGTHLDRIQLTFEPQSADYSGTFLIDEIFVGDYPDGSIFHLEVIQPEELTVDLGADTILESQEVFILDAGNTGAEFIWNTDDTTQTIGIDTGGVYIVMVRSSNQCTASDEVSVTFDIENDIGNIDEQDMYIYPNPNDGLFYLYA
ncbi:MAG: hypothetical protein KAT15_05245, partial [Bacteroidales bacterium]|nr:hypothetical protein [Bacteroidales bacterium]